MINKFEHLLMIKQIMAVISRQPPCMLLFLTFVIARENVTPDIYNNGQKRSEN